MLSASSGWIPAPARSLYLSTSGPPTHTSYGVTLDGCTSAHVKLPNWNVLVPRATLLLLHIKLFSDSIVNLTSIGCLTVSPPNGPRLPLVSRRLNFRYSISQDTRPSISHLSLDARSIPPPSHNLKIPTTIPLTWENHLTVIRLNRFGLEPDWWNYCLPSWSDIGTPA